MNTNNRGGYPTYLPSGADAKGFLRINQVVELLGIGKSTVYYFMYQGKFPKPIKLGPRTAVWRRSDIDEWMEARGQASLEQTSLGAGQPQTSLSGVSDTDTKGSEPKNVNSGDSARNSKNNLNSKERRSFQ